MLAAEAGPRRRSGNQVGRPRRGGGAAGQSRREFTPRRGPNSDIEKEIERADRLEMPEGFGFDGKTELERPVLMSPRYAGVTTKYSFPPMVSDPAPQAPDPVD